MEEKEILDPTRDLEAERTALSVILNNPEIFKDHDLGKFRPEFFTGNRTSLGVAISTILEDKETPDISAVDRYLTKNLPAQYDEWGGVAELQNLMISLPFGDINFDQILDRLIDSHKRRKIKEISHDLVSQANTAKSPTNIILNQAQEQLVKLLNDDARENTFHDFDSAQLSFLESLREKVNLQEGESIGVSFGYRSLDNILTGMAPGQMLILAARPGMGKSALALEVACNVAVDQKLPALFTSLEMSSEELMQRLLSLRSGVPHDKIKRGQMSENDWANMAKTWADISGAPLYIEENPSTSVSDIYSKALKVHNLHGELGLIVVDYIQLMGNEGNRNRQEEVSQMSRNIKVMAKDLGVPILALSQLNRNLENRDDRRPLLSDLRESGCLTYESKVLMADGSSREIGEICKSGDRNLSVLSLDIETQQFVEAKMTHAFSSGVKKTYELKLASGKTLNVTGNHKIKTWKGWTRVKDLEVGKSLIHTPRDLSFLNSSPVLSDDEIILLGQLLGDGCLGVAKALSYATNDDLNAIAVANAAESFLDSDVKWDWNNHSKNWQLRLTGKYPTSKKKKSIWRLWLESLDLYGVKSINKFIPNEILNKISDNQVRLLLGHLWATDGSVTSNRETGRVGVYYSTSSKALAADIQELLLRLNILSRIYKVQKEGYAENFHVKVSDSKNQIKFLSNVNINGRRGKLAEEALDILYEKGSPNTNVDFYPWEIWDDIKRDMCKSEITTRGLAKLLEEDYSGSYLTGGNELKKRHLTRDRGIKFESIIADEKLLKQLKANSFWDKVVSITEMESVEVFDATVEYHHNFVANGIVVHNSLEQDADVVMFLYRDSVYHPTTADQGIAEVIIEKNRHGARGTARMAFLDSHASFKDLAKTTV